MKRVFGILSVILLLASCREGDIKKEELVIEGKTVEHTEGQLKAHVEKHEVLKVEEAYAKLIGKDSVKVLVEGIVNDMCQKDGCWMTVNFDDKNELLVFLDQPDNEFAQKHPVNKELIIDGYMYSKKIDAEAVSAFIEHIGLEGRHDFKSKNILSLKAISFKEKS
jgi:hypothetical protein